MTKGVKLVALDLDGTLWDCEDISLLTPPFRRVEEGVMVDSEGREVRVREGAEDFLKWCVGKGLILVTLSWNDPGKALEALRALGLLKYFRYHAIEYHPRKHEMLLKLLRRLRSEGINVRPEEVVYVDDRDIHVDDMVKHVGPVEFLHFGIDVKDFHELRKVLEGLVSD